MSSDSPSHGVAASFLEDAIQVYRTVPRDQRGRHACSWRSGSGAGRSGWNGCAPASLRITVKPTRERTVEAPDRQAKATCLQLRIQFLGEGTQGCPRQMATRIERRATLAADPNNRYQHVRVVAVGVRAGFSLRFVISHGGYSCHPSRPHIHPSISANSRSGSCGHRLSCYTWTAWGCVASSSWRRCH